MGSRRAACICGHLLHFLDVGLVSPAHGDPLTVYRISKLLDKLNTYPCTQTIEDGCLALGQKAECRTDKDLYHVIRLQKIIENIESLAKSPGLEAEAEIAYMRVRSQLEEFRAFLSVDVSDSRQLHLLCISYSLDTDYPRSTIHAIPHCEAIPLPGRLFRAQSPAIARNAP